MTTVLTTADQMRRFNQAQVRAALRLYLRIGMLPSRGVTMGMLLEQAGKHTGCTYAKRRGSCTTAIADLDKLLA